jgi:hypothetical protein
VQCELPDLGHASLWWPAVHQLTDVLVSNNSCLLKPCLHADAWPKHRHGSSAIKQQSLALIMVATMGNCPVNFAVL